MGEDLGRGDRGTVPALTPPHPDQGGDPNPCTGSGKVPMASPNNWADHHACLREGSLGAGGGRESSQGHGVAVQLGSSDPVHRSNPPEVPNGDGGAVATVPLRGPSGVLPKFRCDKGNDEGYVPDLEAREWTVDPVTWSTVLGSPDQPAREVQSPLWRAVVEKH